jgi:hypothetical protein
MTRHPNPEAATGSRGTTSDGGAAAQCEQEKPQQQQQQQIRKLRGKIIDNDRRRSSGKLRLSSSCNLRIINKRNNSLSSSRSIDNSRRSQG